MRSKDRSNRCGDITIIVIFKMAAAAILNFQKFRILTVDPLHRANMRHHAKFHQNRSNGCRDMATYRFSKWRPSAVLNLLGAIGTTYDDLVVSIVVQNLAEIRAVVSII